MTIEELNEIVISYGLNLKVQDTFYYGFFRDVIVLMYDNADGKAAVWLGDGFSDYAVYKDSIERLVKECIVALKEEEMKQKLENIDDDFH